MEVPVWQSMPITAAALFTIVPALAGQLDSDVKLNTVSQNFYKL